MNTYLTISNNLKTVDTEKIIIEGKKKQVLSTFILTIVILGISFGIVFLKQFGAVILLILGLTYFFTKKVGQELLVFLTLIFSTNVLEFFNVDLLPYLQLGPGLRFNGIDLLIIPLSIRSFISLKRQGINNSTMNFILFLLLLSTLYVIIGLIFKGSPKEAGLNYYRILFYPAFYFALFKYLLIEDKRDRLLLFLGFLVLISTIIQIYEFMQDYRLVIPGFDVHNIAFYQEGIRIFTAGGERLYIWSRTTGFLLVVGSIFLALFLNRVGNNNLNLTFSLISLLGFILATVRVWLVVAAIAILIILVFSLRKKTVLFTFSFIAIVLSITVYQISILTATPGKVDLITSLIGRVASIPNPNVHGEQNTFVLRVILNRMFFDKFLESPIWGHGFGQTVYNNFYSNDVGITNRLVQFGLIGTLPIIIFTISNILKIISEIKFNNYLSKKNKVILMGVLGILISHLPAYLWQLDFWGAQLVFVILIAFAVADSIFFENGKKLK